MEARTSPDTLDRAAVFAALLGATAVFAADVPRFTVGDYLIVQSTAAAAAGDLVLAMLAGVGATVGRMVTGADGGLRLRPFDGGEDVEAGSESLSVRGIVRAVARVL